MQFLRIFSLLDQLSLVSRLKPIPCNTELSGVTITRRHATFSKSFYGLPIGSFPNFNGSLISLAKTPLKCLVSCLITFQQCHLNFQWVPGDAGIPRNKHAESLPKVGASLPTAIVTFPSSQLSLKPVTPSITNEDVTFPHSPSHLICSVPTVSTEELVLSRPICF